ncbi:MAG: bifunctional histidinol-phosphatase/imidazoleglycerol-phosphate dehydratase HisB [Clostridium sp.]|nr:bifunctional histidinol-phosphatase/imidazoleglycerol-phosphate dehydratase HisB [Clostridium sp.]
MKKALFIDRDGTLIREPVDEQIDALDKLSFVPGVMRHLGFLREHTDYEFVMVSNQDGLGTEAFPEDTFWPAHNLMMSTLEGEGITFDEILIDRSFPTDNLPTRKPGTGMLTRYMEGDYDLPSCYVIGDRETDAQLARNLGCKAVILKSDGVNDDRVTYVDTWAQVADIIYAGERKAEVVRITHETDITVRINLDGRGQADIHTGLGFFDHMLEQIARHGNIDLYVSAKGDLHVDEHHTIEDTALALGECLHRALADKRGIERYGYTLPMDDCLCTVALDFGGRPWLVWDTVFHRERIGDVPCEMFLHFFKSLSDAARMNLNVRASGDNEHHKIEGIFKAFARSLKMAVRRDIRHYELPSSKGVL